MMMINKNWKMLKRRGYSGVVEDFVDDEDMISHRHQQDEVSSEK